VWNDRSVSPRPIFVDDSIGQPGRADGKSPRIALTFPSGAKCKGEFRERLFVGSARTQPRPSGHEVRFLNANEGEQFRGRRHDTVPAARITFKAGEQFASSK
jgi:hypothetical protein